MAGNGFGEYPGIKVCFFSFKVRETSSDAGRFDNPQLEGRDSTIMPHYNATQLIFRFSRGDQKAVKRTKPPPMNKSVMATCSRS